MRKSKARHPKRLIRLRSYFSDQISQTETLESDDSIKFNFYFSAISLQKRGTTQHIKNQIQAKATAIHFLLLNIHFKNNSSSYVQDIRTRIKTNE